jgi:hypothetical protein
MEDPVMEVLFKRQDGSLIISLGGLPYHLEKDDPRFPEYLAVAGDAPLETAPEPEPLPVRRIGSPREFLRLFTAEEQAAFVAARSESIEIDVWWLNASAGRFSLDHPSVVTGLGALIAAGVITDARSSEIQGADFNA